MGITPPRPRWKRHRSAVSGRFVSERFAARNPKTTVSETVRPRPAPAPTPTPEVRAAAPRPTLVVVVMEDGSVTASRI